MKASIPVTADSIAHPNSENGVLLPADYISIIARASYLASQGSQVVRKFGKLDNSRRLDGLADQAIHVRVG